MKKLNEKGMTLIEVIISMAIMAMVLVPLTSILMSTYKINAQSQNNMEAKSAAMLVIDAIEEDIRLAKGIKIYPPYPYMSPSLNDGESKIYFEAEEPDNPDDPHNTDLIQEEKTSTGTTAKTLVTDNLFYNKAHRIEFVKKGEALIEIRITIGKYPEQDLDDPDIDKYTMTKTIKLVQPISTGTELIDDSLIDNAGLTSGIGIVITKF